MVHNGEAIVKRIISYSLWGSNPLYLNGARRVIRTRPEFYPEWTIRVYVDGSVPAEFVAELEAGGCEVVRKPDAPAGMGLYWRFEAMYDDPDIERFMVRDFDSPFLAREVAAVNEWIQLDVDFHIMRDNRVHETPILGGMWGAKAGCIRDFKQMLSLWWQGFTPHSTDPRSPFYGSDQEFLGRYVWPVIQGRFVAHDEYFTDGRFGPVRPFPIPRTAAGEYVGMVA